LFRIYRAYGTDMTVGPAMRKVHTQEEAMHFARMYEASAIPVAVYRDESDGTETLIYDTDLESGVSE
jgi:hypothetical protein